MIQRFLVVAVVSAALPLAAQKMPEAPKGLQTPRTTDGRVDFSGVYHAPGYGPSDPPVRNGETIARNIARDLKPDEVPMLPSAQELYKQRNRDQSKDDPEGLCLPMGTPRKDPYPWQIMQTGKLFLILYEGNIHTFRQVFLDREHDPKITNTWWGDSVGHWDGDALVVDTIGFNDKAWLDLVGHPRTHQAHVIERFTRPELGRMVVEITIDDPGAYSRPWTVVEHSQLAPGWELFDYQCNENNRDVPHLVGK